MKQFARAMEIGFDRVFRDIKRFGNLADPRSKPVVLAQSRLVQLGESLYALFNGFVALSRFDLLFGPRPGSRKVMKRSLLDVWTAKASPFFDVDGVVESDAVDPGAELGFTAKGLERMVDLQKDLLRDILSFGNELFAEDRNGEAKDSVAVTANQFREGFLVAALRASNELGVVVHAASA
jgi:hypothetical protein